MFLKQKKFWLNLVISLGCLGLIIFLMFKGLDYYTYHSQSVNVPDLTGLSAEEAKKEIEKIGCILESVDSLYEIPEGMENKGIGPGDIIKQNPKPKEKVKKGRRFYLIVKSSAVAMIEMPNLVNLSVHEAIRILESRGLVFDPKKSSSDLPVSEQLYKGNLIKPGTKIPKGSVISLNADSMLTDEE